MEQHIERYLTLKVTYENDTVVLGDLGLVQLTSLRDMAIDQAIVLIGAMHEDNLEHGLILGGEPLNIQQVKALVVVLNEVIKYRTDQLAN